MAAGTIIAVWTEGGQAYLSVAVQEPGAGRVEYTGSVPLDDAWQAATLAQKKALLVAAVKAQRDAQQPTTQPIAGITGAVTI